MARKRGKRSSSASCASSPPERGRERDGYWFDAAEADRYVEFIESFLVLWQGEHAGEPLVLMPWARQFVRDIVGWKRRDGRRRYRTAYVEIPKGNGKTPVVAALALAFLFLADEPGAEIYCLDESTRVLCDDLTWRPVGDLGVGSGIIAFDEEPLPHYRKLRAAEVVSATTIRQEAHRVIFEDEREVIASSTHVWLGRQYSTSNLTSWVMTRDLRPGTRIRDLGRPWSTDSSRDAGYLAGILDGEGCIVGGQNGSYRRGSVVSFSQRPGVVLDEATRMLRERGFDPVAREQVSGVIESKFYGLHNCMRLIGSLQPHRLVGKARRWLDGQTPNRVGELKVAAVEPLGERDVVAIGTSTSTLFAEGLFSHNSAAADKQQAALTFNDAVRMMTPELVDECVVRRDTISIPDKLSSWRVLSSDAVSKHGYRPSVVVFDELHVQPNRKLWDTLRLGMSKRRDPLMIAITTAGVLDEEHICWQEHEYALAVLSDDPETRVDDPRHYAVIYAAGDDEDPFAEETRRKCNPGYGITINPEELDQVFSRARQNPAEQQNVFQLHLNRWASSIVRNGIPMADWRECGKFELLATKGAPCWLGLDLSSRGLDLTSLVAVFGPHADGSFSVLPYFWLPGVDLEAKARADVFDYPRHVKSGAIATHHGSWVDYGPVREKVNELAQAYDVRDILFDPHNASQMVKWLGDEDGLPVTEVRQGSLLMSEPAKVLVGLVKSHKLRHGSNPVLTWNAQNTDFKVSRDGVNDNWSPVKAKQRKRIDGIVATIMGLRGAAIQVEEHGPSIGVLGTA